MNNGREVILKRQIGGRTGFITASLSFAESRFINMEKITIYHGSNVEVAHPRILQNGFYKDFGYGFYCTKLYKQARRWAMTRKGGTVVSQYTYMPNTNLKMLSFPEMTEEWLDLLKTITFKGSDNYAQ